MSRTDPLLACKDTLGTALNSEKAAWLAAKAALKIGNMEPAGKALEGRNGGRFEDMILKARPLVQADPQTARGFAEYAERIRYRFA